LTLDKAEKHMKRRKKPMTPPLLSSALRTLLLVLVATISFFSQPAWSLEVRFEPVAPGVFAHIGDKGGRSVENEGLNANIGLVVTPAGAVLIDSGATFASARKIHDAVKAVTSQPLRWVINTGGQDHRWLGNSYFQGTGAQLMAHANARADMQTRGGEHLAGLRALLGPAADGTTAVLPARWIEGPVERLNLGGTAIELHHAGGGHTPGDLLVWLPQAGVLFSGDVIYVDRMLGVIPVSNTRAWLASFAQVESLQPAVIVPGHGSVTTLATARQQTRDYLLALRAHMKKAVDDGVDVSAAVRAFDGARWMGLLNAAELAPGNANRTYLEVERE